LNVRYRWRAADAKSDTGASVAVPIALARSTNSVSELTGCAGRATLPAYEFEICRADRKTADGKMSNDTGFRLATFGNS